MTKPIQNFNAINTDLLKGINLIEASAGTGKTYTIAMLVLRFVVEQSVDIKQILVVTFTKAATEELKDRIRSRLVDARQTINGNSPSDDNTLSDWLNGLSVPSELIIQRINHALLDIDQAGIFTIHGFCQRILAEHALESGQLFDSELTGDISTIKQACSDDFWRKNIYLRSAWEASILTAQYQTPDQLMASVGFIDPTLTVLPDFEDLDQNISHLKNLIESHKADIISSLQLIHHALEEGKFTPAFNDNFNILQPTIIAWLSNENTIPADFSSLTAQGLLAGLNGHKFRKSSANPLSSAEQKQVYLNSLEINLTAFDLLDSAISHISLVFRRSLLQTLQVDINKRLQQLNVLSFDDLITRLADALQDEKGLILCQEIQQRFQVALIDEFQDTDKSQWLIFSTLFNTPEHALYLIGDPKQAIYKFRGADIHSYFSAKELAHHQFSLGFNWRSHPQLVEGVNTLFSSDNPFLSDHLQFNPVSAALSSEKGELTVNNQALPPIVLWQLDKGEKDFWTSGKASTEILSAVTNEILDLLLNDFTIKEDSVRPKDIAILVRTNPQAKDFQLALNNVGITAVINSKESVFSSQEAIDLNILLQAISQPGNNTLLKQALTLSWFKLDGQQLFKTLNDELAMDAYFSRFLDYQQSWQKNGLMAMMQLVLANENILPHLSSDKLAERRITNLKHCIELIQQAVIDEHLGINKTLDCLHNNIQLAMAGSPVSDDQQLRLESDDDAVKIITMHSSKGLEFPIIFCPFLWQRGDRLNKEKSLIKCHSKGEMIVDIGSEQFEQHRQQALDEELQEDLRVFYVAVTRAKYRCYINWADVRSAKAKPNISAMASLLGFSTDDFLQQQNKLQQFSQNQASCFEYRLLETDQKISRTWQAKRPTELLSYKKRQRSLYSHWQMSSYSALAYLSIADAPELPNDKAREDNINQAIAINNEQLPRGAHTGNVIHDLLENIPFIYLAENNDISTQREKACLRYGLKTEHPEQIDLLLNNTVNTVLSETDVEFSLKNLSEKQCVKEMPFYLSIKSIDVSQINHILKDCPTYQTLSDKKLYGYLTGFIDLICEYKGQYFVMDYKSNDLENYQQESLISSMLEHNYGLQYWIYTVVLHQYLQNRLPDYNYEQHFGGVKYLFVRGMNIDIANSGVYQIKPELQLVEKLTSLFV